MRQRGSKYEQWISGGLVTQEHSGVLKDGVQFHASTYIPTRGLQELGLVFVGLYSPEGELIFEECYGTRDQSHDEALLWAKVMASRVLGSDV